MKKIIYTLLGLVVILITIIMVTLNPMGKRYAQEYAQNLLKTPVTISQFDASLLNKSLNIDFIDVQNPSGFKNKNAFSLSHFSLKVADGIFSDLIVIEQLHFKGLQFTLEQSGSNVNLSMFIDALSGNQIDSDNTSTGEQYTFTDDKRIRIKSFKVEDIRLKVDTKFIQTDVVVPNILVSNFGGNTGVRLDEVGKRIVDEILQALRKALEKGGIEAGKEKIKETLIRKIGAKIGIDGLQKKLNFDDIKDRFGEGYDNVKERIEQKFDDKIKSKTKDLFKNLGF